MTFRRPCCAAESLPTSSGVSNVIQAAANTFLVTTNVHRLRYRRSERPATTRVCRSAGSENVSLLLTLDASLTNTEVSPQQKVKEAFSSPAAVSAICRPACPTEDKRESA